MSAKGGLKHAFICVFSCINGCASHPVEDIVRSSFAAEHPGCELRNSGIGEGDADTVYYQLRYRCPGDSEDREEEWQYMRQGTTWQRTRRVSTD